MKLFLSGAALSLAAGALLGGAMRPNLDARDARPAGPQMVAGWESGQSTGPFDPGVTLAAYSGQLPDYVLGTDWKRESEPVAVSAHEAKGSDDNADDTATDLRETADDATPKTPTSGALDGASPAAPAASDAGVAVDDDTLPTREG